MNQEISCNLTNGLIRGPYTMYDQALPYQDYPQYFQPDIIIKMTQVLNEEVK